MDMSSFERPIAHVVWKPLSFHPTKKMVKWAGDYALCFVFVIAQSFNRADSIHTQKPFCWSGLFLEAHHPHLLTTAWLPSYCNRKALILQQLVHVYTVRATTEKKSRHFLNQHCPEQKEDR